jgi:hypothetical protein
MAALFSICLNECEQHGIHYHYDDTYGNQDYADFETPNMGVQHMVDIGGSFRTKETGNMAIEGHIDPTGASAKGGQGKITWDWIEVASGSKSGNTSNWSPSVTITANVYCYKDFRYQWKLQTTTYYFRASLRLRVQPPGYSALFVLHTDFSDTCEVSGCTDLSYSREPYACQPPPTTSRSPPPSKTRSRSAAQSPNETRSRSAAQSPNETRSWSAAQSPNDTRSWSAAQSASASASSSSPFTPAWDLLRRPRHFVQVGVFTVFWVLF